MKKVFSFILCLIVTLGIVLAYPIMAYKQLVSVKSTSMTTNAQGFQVPITMNLIYEISQKGNANEAQALVKEYTNIQTETMKDSLNMFLGMSIIIVILTVLIGILVSKKYSKVIGTAIILSGIICMFVLSFFYYAGVTNTVIF